MTAGLKYFIWFSAILLLATLAFPGDSKRSDIKEDLLVVTVQRGILDISIHTVGLLDAAKSHMVSSEIRGNKGKIISLVRDGSWVEKDTVLVRLDSSPFEEEVHRLQGKVDSLKAAVDAAEQLVSWEKNQVGQNIAAREYDLKVAELELNRLIKGDGPLQLAQYQEKAEKAKAENERYSSFFTELQELEKQGFNNPAEVNRAKEDAATYREKYKAAMQRFTSYRDYVLPSLEEAARAKVENSRLILDQNKKSSVFKIANAKARLDQARAEMSTAESSLALARQELDKTVLRAPFAGIAILYEAYRDGQKRKPREGDTVLMNQPILYLPDITKLIVRTQVREVDLFKVREGLKAMVRIDAYPELNFPAEIQSVGALAASAASSGGGGGKYFNVSLDITGQDRRLRPGMTARVHIQAEHAEDVLLLPVQAVFQDDAGRSYCYRITATGPRKTPLTIGRRNELQVEVLSGLQQGDSVSLVDPRLERSSDSY